MGRGNGMDWEKTDWGREGAIQIRDVRRMTSGHTALWIGYFEVPIEVCVDVGVRIAAGTYAFLVGGIQG